MPIDCKDCPGLCCRQMTKICPDYDNGRGVCKYLDENGKCSIYEDRPFICNTDKIYEKYFSNKYSIEQWQEINHNACQLLKDAYKEETNVQQ